MLAVVAPLALAYAGLPAAVVAGTVVVGLCAIAGVRALQQRFGFAAGGQAMDMGEEEYRMVITSLHEGICVHDADYTIIANNPAAERILGLSARQLRGASSLDPQWRCIHEDGSPFPGEEHPAPLTLRSGLASHGVVMGIHRPDGSLVWIEINSEPIAVAGEKPRAVVVSFIDVTAARQREVELRLAKQRLDDAIAALDAAFVMFDADERMVVCNDAFRQYYPSAATAMVPGRTYHEILTAFFAGGGSFPGVTEPLAYIDKRLAQFRAPTAPFIQQQHGRWLRISEQRSRSGGIVSLRSDITEVMEARTAAESGARAKSHFLATMSHEIRTPMNGIIGMADLLAGTPLNREQREYVKTVHGCAESLLLLINDILDFSKIDAGHLQLEDAVIPVLHLAEDAVSLLAEQAQAKGVELVCMIDDDVPEQICGDPGRLRQILINLLSNAVKFTDAGVVTLRVGIEDANLVFVVRDTGIGIDAETVPRLFQAFMQADASMSRRFGGTGLGLAISLRLAKLMHGGINVISDLGKGSTFSLWLPLATSLGARPAGPSFSGKRVLCVDAQSATRAALRRHLQRAGAEVDEVESGSEVSARLQQVVYDLVVLDRHIADPDGLELAATLRGRPGVPPIILLTHLNERIDDQALPAAGLAACISKPVRRDALLSAMVRSLGRMDASGQYGIVKVLPPLSQSVAGQVQLLVVEDNLVNQRVITALLNRLGITAQTVGGGVEALALLGTDGGGFQAVLMDCQMPGMDGFVATATWRAREGAGTRLPVIALTANVLPGDRERCLAAGMDDYLTKPVRLELLHETLQRWVPQLRSS